MKIVSLVPAATEIVSSLGLLDDLVGVSHACDHPRSVVGSRAVVTASRRAPQEAGPLFELDPGLLAELQPDLVITQHRAGVPAVSVEALQGCLDAGGEQAVVVSLQAQDYAGILNDIRAVAAAAGVSEAGAELCARLDKRWTRLGQTPAPSAHRVVALDGTAPLSLAGHWVPEMLEAAGAVPVGMEPGQASRQTTWSELAEVDPDMILVAVSDQGISENVTLARAIYEDEAASVVPAVRRRALWAVDASAYLSRPGPRVVRGAEILSGMVRGANVTTLLDTELVPVFPAFF